MKDRKILVAYFSCTGTTRAIAGKIAKAVVADLFEIKPAMPYTKADLDWTNAKSRSSIEKNTPSYRPAIAEKLPNMAEYDTVFLGFPIWWYVAPSIISTFLESYDFSGKTIVLFATSGSSGMGQTEQKLKLFCPASVTWLPARRLSGNISSSELATWISSLNI